MVEEKLVLPKQGEKSRVDGGDWPQNPKSTCSMANYQLLLHGLRTYIYGMYKWHIAFWLRESVLWLLQDVGILAHFLISSQ